jgi:hypothetical protein
VSTQSVVPSVTTQPRLLGDPKQILISDRPCVDCGGPVHVFLVPDKVWDGLGYALDDYACLACVAHRLNPELEPDAESVSKEIYKQRRRFKLKNFNRYCDILKLRSVAVVSFCSNIESVTAKQAGGRSSP